MNFSIIEIVFTPVSVESVFPFHFSISIKDSLDSLTLGVLKKI
jgi:hypothetical protein